MGKHSIVKNSLLFTSYKLLMVLYPLITISYVSHILLSNGVGKVASAQNLAQYFVLISTLGIPNYGIREIARVSEDNDKKSKVFYELFMINFFSTIICVCAYYFITFSFSLYKNEPILYLITGITIILNIINVDWFYQGIEEYTYITVRSLLVKVLSLILLFYFVRDTGDYINYAIIYIVGIAGNNLANFINLKRNGIHVWRGRVDFQNHIKPIFIMFGTTLAIELYTLVDTTMITYMCESENVAYYTNSIKIVRMVIMLVTAASGVLLPRLSNFYSNGRLPECKRIINRTFSYMFFLIIPSGVGLFLVAEAIVPVFFGISFQGAIITLKIASLLVWTLGFSNLFGTQILLTFGKESQLLVATIAGAISNIVLNLFLIKMYQQNGAALASVISEALVTMITYGYAQKCLRFDLKLKQIAKTIIATFVMGIAVCILKMIINNSYELLISAVIIGGMVYFLVSMFLKNQNMIDLLEYGRRILSHGRKDGNG